MPAGVGYAKKRTTYKKKSYAKKTKSKSAKGFYGGIERKFLDTSRQPQAMNTSWTVILPSAPAGIECLTIPVQNTTESGHIGRTYFINSIFVKGVVGVDPQLTQGTPIEAFQWRILLVWDTQTRGVTLNATNIMDAGATNDVNSYRNLQHTSRYIVLGDTGVRNFNVFQMNEGINDKFANQAQIQYWELSKTFKKGIKVRTDGITGVIGSVTDNSFGMIGIASNTTANVTFESRMRFSEQEE